MEYLIKSPVVIEIKFGPLDKYEKGSALAYTDLDYFPEENRIPIEILESTRPDVGRYPNDPDREMAPLRMTINHELSHAYSMLTLSWELTNSVVFNRDNMKPPGYLYMEVLASNTVGTNMKAIFFIQTHSRSELTDEYFRGNTKPGKELIKEMVNKDTHIRRNLESYLFTIHMAVLWENCTPIFVSDTDRMLEITNGVTWPREQDN